MMDLNESPEFFTSVVIFASCIVVILIYLIFFQQSLTALLYKVLFKCFLPNSVSVEFERFSFSILTGKFAFHRLHLVTQDMSAFIGCLRGSFYYWRKIPEYSKIDEDLKTRFDITIYALDITLYNRSWSASFVEEILKKFESGMSTEDVTEYMKTIWKEPAHYQLSLLYRAFLPFSFHIIATSVTIGNPFLPSYLVFYSENLRGGYSINPRETPESHIKSFMEIQMISCNLKSFPQEFDAPPIFHTAMRDIHERSRKIMTIIDTESINLKITSDLPGCYVHDSDMRELAHVSKEPTFVIDVVFGSDSTIEWGPYTDKIRRAFMTFFMPFYFNNPMIYPSSRNMIRVWQYNISFPTGIIISIPFVTNQMQTESMRIIGGKDSSASLSMAMAPANPQDSKMSFQASLTKAIVETSICDQPVIVSDTLLIDFGMFYPTPWHGATQLSVCCHFDNAIMILHPYHIDFFTQLSTDWASWYPFLVTPDTAHNFFPYTYFITLEMEPVTITMLTSPMPSFNQILDFESHPHAKLSFKNFSFKLSIPMLEFSETEKQMSYSAFLNDGTIMFVPPLSHIHRIRRGDDIYDYMTVDKVVLSGSYRWCTYPNGDVQIPLSVKVSNLGGLFTIMTFNDFLTMLSNYIAYERLLPEYMQPYLQQYPPGPRTWITHSNVTVSIDFGAVKMPFDLYDTHNCFIIKLSSLLLSIEGYFPFWHTILKIQSIIVDLPQTSYPNESFFQQNISENPENEMDGSVHVDGISFGLRTIQSQLSEKPVLSSLISFDIGKISGFTYLPQVVSLIDFAFNATYLWFSEDTKNSYGFNKWWYFGMKQIRVSLMDVSLFIDFGRLGLCAALLPSGVAVYADSLIDQIGHFALFVVLPSIDVIHLMQESDNSPLVAVFRLTTFMNIFRNTKYNGLEQDRYIQTDLLQQYDKLSQIFPFIWGSYPELPDDFFDSPKLFNPDAYKSRMDDTFSLVQLRASDPSSSGQYVISVPSLEYSGKEHFASPEDTVDWLHHFGTTRFYNHSFETKKVRHAKVSDLVPSSGLSVSLINIPDESERFSKCFFHFGIVIPHELRINLVPASIPVFASVIEMINIQSNLQMLTKHIRKQMGVYQTELYYHEYQTSIIIPEIGLCLYDPDFKIEAYMNGIHSFSTIVPKEDCKKSTGGFSSLTIMGNIIGKSSNPIQITLGEIIYSTKNNESVFSIGNFSVLFSDGSISLMLSIIRNLLFELMEIPSYNLTQRMEDLECLIKTSPFYTKEIKRIKNIQYKYTNPMISPDITATLSSLYSTIRIMGIPDFVGNFRSVGEIPSLTNGEFRTTYLFKPIRIDTVLNGKKSYIEVNMSPILLVNGSNCNYVSGGVDSLKINLDLSINRFVEALSDINFGNNNQNERLKASNCSKMRFVIEDIDFTYDILNVNVESLSLSLSMPYIESKLQSLSITSSLKGLCLTIMDDLCIEITRISLCQNGEHIEGVLHIEPITIRTSILFLSRPNDYISRLVPVVKYKASSSTSNSKDPVFKIEMFNYAQISLLIDPIKVFLVLSEQKNVQITFPGSSGLISVENSLISFFTFIHAPIIEVSECFSFSLADFLLHGSVSFNDQVANLFLMIGKIYSQANSSELSHFMSTLNEILSSISHNKATSNPSSIETIEPEIKPNLKSMKMNSFRVSFQFLMPIVSISLSEISASFDLTAVFLMFEMHEYNRIEAEIQTISLSLGESVISCDLSIGLIKEQFNIMFDNNRIMLSSSFFALLPRINRFIDVVQSGMRNQDKVNDLIRSLNTQIHNQVEKGADLVINSIVSNKSNIDHISFPDNISNSLFFEFRNIGISMGLVQGGDLRSSIQLVSMLVQSRNSNEHHIRSNALTFEVSKVAVVLDSSEFNTSGTSSDALETVSNTNDFIAGEKLSMLTFDSISISAISFMHILTIKMDIQKFILKLFPTFYLSIMKIVDSFSSNNKQTTKLRSKTKQKSSSDITISNNENNETSLELDFNASMHNTELFLYPISNVLSIPSVEFYSVFSNNKLRSFISINNVIKVSLSPQSVSWIGTFAKTFVPNASNAQISKTPVENNNSNNKTMFELSISTSIKGFEIALGCQPKRNDLSMVISLMSLSSFFTKDGICGSISNLSFKTNNLYSPSNLPSHGNRLIDFSISDIGFSKQDQLTNIHISGIEFSFSSNKIDELSVFRDIWVMPLLSAFASKNSGTLNNSDVTVSTDNNAFHLSIDQFHFFYNYSSGAGNLLLKIWPIFVELRSDYSMISFPTVALNSFGQISSQIEMNGIMIIKSCVNPMIPSLIFAMNQVAVDMSSLEDPFFGFSLQQINFYSKMSSRKNHESSSIVLSVSEPKMKVSSQTFTNFQSFVTVIVEPFLNSSSKGKVNTEPELLANNDCPNFKIILLMSNFNIGLYKYYFKDNDAISLSIGLLNVLLAVHIDGSSRFLRGTQFALSGFELSKINQEVDKMITKRNILVLPPLLGTLNTLQSDSDSPNVKYDFVVDFDGLIEPSLALADYEYLVILIKFIVKQFNNESNQPSKGSSPKKARQQYNYSPNKYQFNPGFKVGIGASIKPNVSWLLSQLGIDDEHIIPSYLYEYVVLSLERLLKGVAKSLFK